MSIFQNYSEKVNKIALEKLGLAYSKCKGLLVDQHPGWFEEEECEDCPLYHFCYDDLGVFHGVDEMISMWEPIDFLLKHAEDEE